MVSGSVQCSKAVLKRWISCRLYCISFALSGQCSLFRIGRGDKLHEANNTTLQHDRRLIAIFTSQLPFVPGIQLLSGPPRPKLLYLVRPRKWIHLREPGYPQTPWFRSAVSPERCFGVGYTVFSYPILPFISDEMASIDLTTSIMWFKASPKQKHNFPRLLPDSIT